jgi:hypothetical protein
MNSKTTPESKACNTEIQDAKQTVAIVSPAVTKILKPILVLGIRLRNIGNCPNTRSDSRIKAKTEESCGNREARTTEADNAALIEITEDKLRLFSRK